MKKRDFRVLLTSLADKVGLLRFSEHAMRRRWSVLTYHRVLPEPLMNGYLFPSLAVPEPIFSQQISFLTEQFLVVRLDDGLNSIVSGKRTDKPLVSITFDDGYSDNWLHAAPVLEHYKVPATFFIVSGLVGTDNSLWYDVAARCWNVAAPEALNRAVAYEVIRPTWQSDAKPVFEDWMAHLKSLSGDARARVIQRLEDPGPDKNRLLLDRVMSAQQLRALHRQGHQIGSHSCTHPLLPQLSDTELEVELRKSKGDLESILDSPIDAFCYPNGDLDQRVVDAVRAAGYRTAATTQNTWNRANLDRLRIGRIDMHPGHSTDSRGIFHEPSFRTAMCF